MKVNSKKGFTLIEIVSAVLIFAVSISTIYLIISRNIREQMELKNQIDGLNFFKLKYYNISSSEDYKDFLLDKKSGDDLFGKKEYTYEVLKNDVPILSLYAVE